MKTVEVISLSFVGFPEHCLLSLNSKDDGHFWVKLTPSQTALLVGESAAWFTDHYQRQCNVPRVEVPVLQKVETKGE